jgi:8-oxo-dGTP pyrophosphatase MutT (NUDIX family)
LESYFTNSHGVKTAVFTKFFVRGEFHFHSESEIAMLDSWKGVVLPGEVERIVLVDKSGAFREKIEKFCQTRPVIDEGASFKQNFLELASGIIMEWNVLCRKDLFRAGTLHSMNLHYLARLFSLVHGKTDHLYSPRLLEKFMSEGEYKSFSECFAGLDFDSLRDALEKMALLSAELSRENGDTDIVRARRAILERVVERSYRVEGVITDGEKVLFIKHSGNDGRPDEWLLPGGGKIAGESDETAVRREVLEETCLDIEPVGMIAEIELPDDGLYYSAKMFRFIYDGSNPSPGSEPEDVNGNYYTISEVKWIDLSDLSSIAAQYRAFPHMPERLEAIRNHLLRMNR